MPVYIRVLLEKLGGKQRFRYLVAGLGTSAGVFLLREILCYALDLAAQLDAEVGSTCCAFFSESNTELKSFTWA